MKTVIDFRNECLAGGAISCTADYLHDNWLVTKDLANIWWSLLREEREVVADYVIKTWATENIRYHIDDNGEWEHALCLVDAIIRLLRIGNGERYKDAVTSCYWSQDKATLHPYYEECFYLPVYFGVVVTAESGSGFGHAICCLQMDHDISDMDSWRFFQYKSVNIRPGDTQMPCECEGKRMRVSVRDTIRISCSSQGGNKLVEWVLNTDCTVMPTDVCSYIEHIGGIESVGVFNILDIIGAYKGDMDIGFTPGLFDVMGAIAYYKGDRANGNKLTGCTE